MRQSALIAALMALGANVPASPNHPRRPFMGPVGGGAAEDPRGSKATQEAAIQSARAKRARRQARNLRNTRQGEE